MRLKTMLLGGLFIPLALGLLSGEDQPELPDKGFNPGERLPSIVVDGRDLAFAVAREPQAVVVVWSVDDATSRVANAWACNNSHLRATNTPVYSVCIDGDEMAADLFTKIDGAECHSGLYALKGKELGKWSTLARRGSGKVYYTSYGTIQRVISTEILFETIQ